MRGKITIAILCTVALAMLLIAVATYLTATRGDAQDQPKPRSITGPAVRAPSAPEAASVGIVAAGSHIYIVDSGKVYMLKADTLQVLKSASYKAVGLAPTPGKQEATSTKGGKSQ